MPASSAFLRSFEHDHDAHETSAPVSNAGLAATPSVTRKAPETAPRIAAEAEEKPRPAQPHFSRKPARARDRKPAPASSSSRANRGPARTSGSARHGSPVRWAHDVSKNGNGNGNGNGKQNGAHANGNDLRKAKPAAARGLRNGHVSAGKPAANSASRPASRRASAVRTDARSRRKPALTASAKAGNRTRYGFTAPSAKRSKKRG
jgi:hypothetical protein